ncbi:hypothetical protein BH09MYX1_BH09MYX1_64660 [soil metagenome]
MRFGISTCWSSVPFDKFAVYPDRDTRYGRYGRWEREALPQASRERTATNGHGRRGVADGKTASIVRYQEVTHYRAGAEAVLTVDYRCTHCGCTAKLVVKDTSTSSHNVAGWERSPEAQ